MFLVNGFGVDCYFNRQGDKMDLQYYFTNDFSEFKDFFSVIEHREREYEVNESISDIGEAMNEMYYIKTGTVSSNFLHESGNIKSFAFYGKGSLVPLYFPGEANTLNSLMFTAVSKLEVYVFERRTFLKNLEKNHALNKAMYGAYIKLVSLLIQESANQIFCNGMEKICNFFYIYLENTNAKENIIYLTQNNISQIVGINRVNVAKYLNKLRAEEIIETHRNRVIVINVKKLSKFCSQGNQIFLNE